MKFIDDLKIETIHTRDFDEKIAAADQLVGIFFWGENCPNCEIAKNTLSERKSEMPHGISNGITPMSMKILNWQIDLAFLEFRYLCFLNQVNA